MTKTYKVARGFSSDWEMTVVIDHQKADSHIKNMVEFWYGWEQKLKEANGDYTSVFLKNLGEEVFYQVFSEGYSLIGIINHFLDGYEGWCPMNGEFGITITGVDESDIDYDDFVVETLEE